MKKIFIQTEDNTIEHVVKNMLEREYQFEIETIEGKCKISFLKGVWSLNLEILYAPFGEMTILVSDSPCVLYLNQDDISLAESFIDARLEWHKEHTYTTSPWRTIPSASIYDYLKLRLRIEQSENINITVSKSGRIKE